MFDKQKIEIDEVVEARKQKITDDAAWELLSAADEIIVGKGKKILRWNPADDAKEEILKTTQGRTGNLRAPTLKIGNNFVVGYNDEMYEKYVI